MSVLSEVEIEAIAAQVQQAQRRKAEAPIMSVADFKQALAEAETRKFLERRERARNGQQAREAALAATAKERQKLERWLQELTADRVARLGQHDRNRARIVEEFAGKENAVRDGLAAIAERVEREALAAERSPVKVTVPPVRVGIDDTATTATPMARFLGGLPDKGRKLTEEMGGGR